MANSRNKGRGDHSGRDAGGFVALPWSVLDCVGYGRLSHPARALLIEVARQFVRDNNGRLLLSFAYLSKRGWNSRDVINRAKHELLAAGFIHETVMGHRPNKASWYAVTWRTLDKINGYDVGAVEGFRRGAYMDGTPLQPQKTREHLYKKWELAGKEATPNAPTKNESLSPSGGLGMVAIGPSHGLETNPVGPSGGPISPVLHTLSSPPDGHHLEMPSTAVESASGPRSSCAAFPRLPLHRMGHGNRYRWLIQDQVGAIANLTITAKSLAI